MEGEPFYLRRQPFLFQYFEKSLKSLSNSHTIFFAHLNKKYIIFILCKSLGVSMNTNAYAFTQACKSSAPYKYVDSGKVFSVSFLEWV